MNTWIAENVMGWECRKGEHYYTYFDKSGKDTGFYYGISATTVGDPFSPTTDHNHLHL